MTIIVPPGGFAGFAQQTPATQALFQRAGRTGGIRSAAKRAKRRKTRAAAPARRRKTRAAAPARRRKTRGAKLVKGSAAAKRRMAKLRRMRKR